MPEKKQAHLHPDGKDGFNREEINYFREVIKTLANYACANERKCKVVMLLKAFCIVWFLVILTPANAAVITFQFSGDVTQVPIDDVFGDIAAGDAIQGSYSFDTAATDLIAADPSTGSYSWSAPLGMTVTIGSHEFTASGSLNIGVLNSFVDQYTVFAISPSGDVTMELFLQDNSGAVFAGDQLPLTPPSLRSFTQKDFHLIASLAGGDLQADGELSALTSAEAPEPAPTGFVVAGMIGILLTRRMRFFRTN